jgi:hypothetical protein
MHIVSKMQIKELFYIVEIMLHYHHMFNISLEFPSFQNLGICCFIEDGLLSLCKLASLSHWSYPYMFHCDLTSNNLVASQKGCPKVLLCVLFSMTCELVRSISIFWILFSFKNIHKDLGI